MCDPARLSEAGGVQLFGGSGHQGLEQLVAPGANLTTRGFISLARSCPRKCRYLQYTQATNHPLADMVHLDLSNAAQLEDMGVFEIARRCKQLQVLLLDGCPSIGSESLLPIVKSCRSLRVLQASLSVACQPQHSLWGTFQVESRKATHFMRRECTPEQSCKLWMAACGLCCPYLRELRLYGRQPPHWSCDGWGDVLIDGREGYFLQHGGPMVGIDGAATVFPVLAALDVRAVGGVTAALVESLSNWAPKLETFLADEFNRAETEHGIMMRYRHIQPVLDADLAMPRPVGFQLVPGGHHLWFAELVGCSGLVE